jgi:hypothetical protein
VQECKSVRCGESLVWEATRDLKLSTDENFTMSLALQPIFKKQRGKAIEGRLETFDKPGFNGASFVSCTKSWLDLFYTLLGTLVCITDEETPATVFSIQAEVEFVNAPSLELVAAPKIVRFGLQHQLSLTSVPAAVSLTSLHLVKRSQVGR